MATLLFDAQGKPVTPASGQMYFYPDNTKKAWSSVDDAGRITTLQSGIVTNCNTGTVSPGASNFYITGSSLALGASTLQVGTTMEWVFGITKSTAGTGTPVFTIVFGTAGTTADTARVTFTHSTADTGVADRCVVRINAVMRAVGASGVCAGIYEKNHIIVGATGFSTPASTQVEQLSTVSSTFDTTTASMIVGVCVNAGTAGAWSIETVQSKMFGI
jgi:hypothetical protein